MVFSFKLADSTIATIVYDVCEAIWQELLNVHMPPVDKSVLKAAAENFIQRWEFEHYLIVLDA